jgi:hypothetical protein
VGGQGGIWPAAPTAAHGWYSFYEASVYEVSAECNSGVGGRSRGGATSDASMPAAAATSRRRATKKDVSTDFYFEVGAANWRFEIELPIAPDQRLRFRFCSFEQQENQRVRLQPSADFLLSRSQSTSSLNSSSKKIGCAYFNFLA